MPRAAGVVLERGYPLRVVDLTAGFAAFWTRPERTSRAPRPRDPHPWSNMRGHPDNLFNCVRDGRVPLPPSSAHLGWELLEVNPAAGTLRARFTARPEFLNPAGLVQGGFVSAMLDETLGTTLGATLDPGQFAPFLEFKVSFMRPARPGALIGHGRVIARSRQIAFVSGELHDARGRVLAGASATAQVMSGHPRA
jgi:uncharacterized protein (TIGR00369 family)